MEPLSKKRRFRWYSMESPLVLGLRPSQPSWWSLARIAIGPQPLGPQRQRKTAIGLLCLPRGMSPTKNPETKKKDVAYCWLTRIARCRFRPAGGADDEGRAAAWKDPDADECHVSTARVSRMLIDLVAPRSDLGRPAIQDAKCRLAADSGQGRVESRQDRFPWRAELRGR
jgi:hypothetical protein